MVKNGCFQLCFGEPGCPQPEFRKQNFTKESLKSQLSITLQVFQPTDDTKVGC